MKYFVMALMVFGLAACDNSEPTANKVEATNEKPVVEKEPVQQEESKHAPDGVFGHNKTFRNDSDLLRK